MLSFYKQKEICRKFIKEIFGGEEYKKFWGHECYFELWNNYNDTFCVIGHPFISSLKEPFVCVGETKDEVWEKAKTELKRQFNSDKKVEIELGLVEFEKFGKYFIIYG